MISKFIIKQSSKFGCDTKNFRAYTPGVNGRPDMPLGVTASTTGNPEFGVKRCAAKAAVRFWPGFASADPEKLKLNFTVVEIINGGGVWEAFI